MKPDISILYFIKNRILFVILVILASIPIAQAQVITLDSVINTIAQRNPMLQEYDKKAQALNAYAEGATSWMPPMIGAGTFMTPYANQMLMDARDEGSWMFSIEQEISNPLKLRANKKYMASQSKVEMENKAYQLNILRSEAKLAYYTWLISEEKIKVLEENKQIVELMLKIAKIRYPYNQSSLGNIYKTEGRLSEVQNMIEMVFGDIEESKSRLKSLMNISYDTDIMIDTSTNVAFRKEKLLIDTADLREQRSDIRQIDKTIEVMKLNQQLQRQQYLPDFKLKFDHMQPLGKMPTQFSAMAMISIPIAPWSSKMYRSEIRGMQYDIEAMQKGREAILIETKGMLTGMASKLERMQTQLDNYQKKIVPALKKNYQTLMLAYEENREQLPMVIDAWEAMNMAQTEYLEKKQAFFQMIVTYEKELEK